jgi:hypothetical protein
MEGLNALDCELVTVIALGMHRPVVNSPIAIAVRRPSQEEKRHVAPEKATLQELLTWKADLVYAFEIFGNPNPLEDGPFGDFRDHMYTWLIDEIDKRQKAH